MQKTVIVVAHPDDEVLWFSSLLADAAKVILVFGDHDAVPGLGACRRRAIAGLPYPTRFFDLREAGSFGCADWHDPQISPVGLELPKAGSTTAKAYADNFSAVRTLLGQELDSTTQVYSHNPWGEYGHEDHVQLFRIVEDLRRDIGFLHYASAYVSKRSATLAARYDTSRCVRLTRGIDEQFSQVVAETYKRNGCWTWQPDWRWNPSEYFFEMPLRASAATADEPRLIAVSWPPSTG
jgi:LmbE family N-acetylglucosaminyl deacetylase